MNEQSFSEMRRAMVASQLRTTGVSDHRVVAAMNRVPRERFVPQQRSALAYADAPVPLVHGRALNPPMTLGRLLSEARPLPSDRALVVGSATGYSAALLAELVAEVVALEEDATLAEAARGALSGAPVLCVQGSLPAGHPERAPYDLILVDGAIETVPETLVAQLAEGGRLATAIVDRGVTRLAVGRKTGGGFALVPFQDANASILPGFGEPATFSF